MNARDSLSGGVEHTDVRLATVVRELTAVVAMLSARVDQLERATEHARAETPTAREATGLRAVD
jgi:outer membrane murein-binding lipoprotein Lpp